MPEFTTEEITEWSKYIIELILSGRPIQGPGMLISKKAGGYFFEIDPKAGGGGSAISWASLKSGSGLNYVADIYSSFAADMTFTAITPSEVDADVKAPSGTLNSGFSLVAGQVYPVGKFLVDGTSTWVILEHTGVN